MTLPPKRSRQQSGIMRGPQREWPKHRAWIKTLPCYVCGHRPVDPHHVRSARNSGTGLKPPDWFLVPLCREHHRQLDSVGMGVKGFQKHYHVDLWQAAIRYAEASPDEAMKRSLRGQDG